MRYVVVILFAAVLSIPGSKLRADNDAIKTNEDLFARRRRSLHRA